MATGQGANWGSTKRLAWVTNKMFQPNSVKRWTKESKALVSCRENYLQF